MANMHHLVVFSIISACMSSCASSYPKKSHAGGNLEDVVEVDRDLDERLKTAAALNVEDKEKLRVLLESKLPGNWDRETCDNIEFLGIVGDRRTIVKLKAITPTSYWVSGQIYSAIDRAIESIQKRSSALSPTS